MPYFYNSCYTLSTHIKTTVFSLRSFKTNLFGIYLIFYCKQPLEMLEIAPVPPKIPFIFLSLLTLL